MKKNIAIVSLKDITGHPTNRLDPAYWVGKANGDKAHKKNEKGFLVEDDTNGKIIVSSEERKEFNTTTNEIKKLTKKIKLISDKLK